MKYVVAIDQSTSGTKAALIDENLRTVKHTRLKHRQYYPAPGYVEHDAEEIWDNTARLLLNVTAGIEPSDLVGIGIANQRETTVLWERATGKSVHRAVVWQDVRAKHITDPMAEHADAIFKRTGLLPSPYYSAAKAAAVLNADDGLAARAVRGELCMGTIDAFLLYRLTGGESFASDYSNAARTQLFDINTLSWSGELARQFGIPECMLPSCALPSDADFGAVTSLPALAGVHVTAMLGDSSASLFGHGCTRPGTVKTSYGTGSSLMMNIGDRPILSKNGLSTSVGYSCGGELAYVLEGNVTCSADTLMWLRDELGLIKSLDELSLAATVDDTDGVFLVPAFAGLGAPWFDENARGIICGMNRGTGKAHVLRAALASIAHQNADVLDAMRADTGAAIEMLNADGGGSVNALLMQMQSDYVPCRVAVSGESELTLRGVGLMAASRAGIFAHAERNAPCAAVYAPTMDEKKRADERRNWRAALEKCR